MSVQAAPGFDLQPSAQQQVLSTNYITNFDFLNQYLPDTYEKEFERYGNRTIASFLRMVGAEMPTNSDMIKWAEQGRLHTKYTNVTSNVAAINSLAILTINDVFNPLLSTGITTAALRVGQTIMLSDNTPGSTNTNKGVIVTAPGGTTAGAVTLTGSQIEVAYYEVTQSMAAGIACTLFIYGSEFAKGTNGMQGSLEANDYFFQNKPIILKDKYSVSGSDMAQIG